MSMLPRKFFKKLPDGSLEEIPRNPNRPVVHFTQGTRTKQAHKAECDINTILKRYTETGQLGVLMKSNPIYGDFSTPVDYQQAMNTVIVAGEQFAALPSELRHRFHNDPQEFLEFASNPSNAKELVSLGLADEVRPSETSQLIGAIQEHTKVLKTQTAKPSKKAAGPAGGEGPDA